MKILGSSGFVLVSGSSGAIGKAVTANLLEAGKSVVCLDTRDAPVIAGKIERRAISFIGDASREDVVERAIASGLDAFGEMSAAIHSAYPKSSLWGEPFERTTLHSLTEDLVNQLGGAIIFSQIASKHLAKNPGGGSIVLLSSIQGIRAPKFHHYEGLSMTSPAVYSAVKGGVISYTRWLAKYLAGSNVRVNCVSPGGIEADQPEIFKERYRRDCLNKGLLSPEDIVGAITFLVSEDSRYLSGQNLVVDDGWSL